PGDEGLNVSVATYYNVQMLDPIYDTLMGGSFIRVQGRVEMQNEGIDKSLGAVPPPPLPDVPIDGTGGTGLGSGPQILPSGSNTVGQGEVFGIRLLNHRDDPPLYDIYLEPLTPSANPPVKLCPPTDDGFTVVETDPNGNGLYNCRISTAIPPGEYRLFSTKADAGPSTKLAAFETVTVLVGDTPLIAIEGGNTWAENTKIKINLLNHQVADEQFNLYFFDGTNETLISGPYPAEPPPVVTWKIPSTASTTCSPSGAGCQIFSRSANLSANDPYAITDIFIIRPEIILAQGQVEYQAGETIRVALLGHTPNKKYEIQVTSTPTGTTPSSYVAAQVTTDSAGQFSTLQINIPDALLSGLPGADDWADGNYVITSHQVDGAGVADLTDFIAEKMIRVDTPTDPYITVDGGYSWPIDSFINIKVHLHDPEEHFLQFGSWRVPTGSAGDTFTPNPTFGTATIGYRIPITAVTGSTPQDFLVRSFKASAPGVEVARVTVRVIPTPVIQVLEGDTVLPDATITIRILNHSPQSPYRIYYGKEIGNAGSAGKSLLTMITDANGEAQATYDLSNLPINPPPDFTDPANCACFGVPYEMYSESFGQRDRLAFTELTIDSADLAITQVQVPLDAQINTTRTVTLTIQNLKPVTIARYFDIDVYLNPSPLVPSYRAGRFNFPGDEKLWQNFVAPNGQVGDTFTITSSLYLGTYGDQDVYGYADTSDFVFAENSETNNIGNTTFQVTCTPTLFTDAFGSSLSSAWQTKRYNTTYTQLNEAQTSGGVLRMVSDGYSTYGPNDDANDRGHALLYRSTPVTTTSGLDVVVKILESPPSGKAGIQLREAINDGGSRKIEFNIYQGSTVQVTYRDTTNADPIYWQGDETTTKPVWLRVEREPNSNRFNFYYSAQTNQPSDWGEPYSSADVSIGDQLYVGLFTASYVNNNYPLSRFDDFSYTDPSSCPPATGLPVPEAPPGLTLCTDLLIENGFETAPPQAWQW
ncbi:MAG: hypothetical protein KDF65_09105, partial [Anaerolineae bacterium]|nr:hypothetical protein [Anaerolineae bacterium]